VSVDELENLMRATVPSGGWTGTPPRPLLSATKENHLVERNNEGSLTLPFAPLSTLLEGVAAEPEWVWDGFVARGWLTIISAPPKAGKTTLVFGLLAAVAKRQPAFLDRPVSSSGALVLSEERQGSLAEKDKRWQLSGGDIHFLLQASTGGTPWPEIVRQAVAYCVAEELDVLVVDTFAAWSGLAGDDENSSGATLERIAPLQEAAAAGLAVIVVSHDRKSGGKHGQGIRGSNALAGAVDILVQVDRPGDELARQGVRVLYGTSRTEKTPEEIAIELTDDRYEARGDTETVRTELETTKIVNEILGAGQATTKDLADALDIPQSTVRRRCQELFSSERIGRTGSGKRNDPHVWCSPDSFHHARSLVAETNDPQLFGDDA
jgi:hypothetical protein